MATKQRYINTASSAGGDGTTNATTGVNRAFVGWEEFEATEGALDGAGDIYNVQVSGYESLGTTRLLFNGFASTVTLNFYAASGEESEALPSQGAGFTSSGTANHLWYNSAYTFTDLRFVDSSTADEFQFVAGAGVVPTWTNCYVKRRITCPHSAGVARTLTLNNSVLGDYVVLSNGEAAYQDTIKLVNSVVGGTVVTYNYNTVDAKNSTFPAADWLLGAGTYTGATTNAVDCLFAEAYAAAQFNGTYSGCSHGVDFTGYFTDSANGNYNLTSSATLALDAGVGTSDGDVPANDANGVARGATTCDIGPYEYVSAGATGTGALSAQAASTAGSGLSASAGSGAIASQAAVSAGAGLSGSAGAGVLAAQTSAVVGAGASSSVGTGVLSAQVAAAAGTGLSISTGSGVLAAAIGSLAGTGISNSVGTGILSTQASNVVGEGLSAGVGIGALTAQVAAISGVGLTATVGAGALSAQAATSTGIGAITLAAILGTGDLYAQIALAAGAGTVTAAGLLYAGVSTRYYSGLESPRRLEAFISYYDTDPYP